MSAAIDLSRMRIVAILNISSGHCNAASEHDVRDILRDAGLHLAELICVDGHALDDAFARLAPSPVDLLIVLGGDGTVRTAIERCASDRLLLMALPGGRMNMLPRALYGAVDWQSALKQTIANPAIRVVSGAEVGKHRFFCAGIFGTPALWADAREAMRDNLFLKALAKAFSAFRRRFSRRLRYRFDASREGKAEAVVVICPMISAALPSEQPALEAAALGLASARAVLTLAWHALSTGWREASNVVTTATESISISARGTIPAVLDGERVVLPKQAEIIFMPSAFRALVPG